MIVGPFRHQRDDLSFQLSCDGDQSGIHLRPLVYSIARVSKRLTYETPRLLTRAVLNMCPKELIDRIAGLSDRIALRRSPILRDDTFLLRLSKSNASAGKYIEVKPSPWRFLSRPLARSVPNAR